MPVVKGIHVTFSGDFNACVDIDDDNDDGVVDATDVPDRPNKLFATIFGDFLSASVAAIIFPTENPDACGVFLFDDSSASLGADSGAPLVAGGFETDVVMFTLLKRLTDGALEGGFLRSSTDAAGVVSTTGFKAGLGRLDTCRT